MSGWSTCRRPQITSVGRTVLEYPGEPNCTIGRWHRSGEVRSPVGVCHFAFCITNSVWYIVPARLAWLVSKDLQSHRHGHRLHHMAAPDDMLMDRGVPAAGAACINVAACFASAARMSRNSRNTDTQYGRGCAQATVRRLSDATPWPRVKAVSPRDSQNRRLACAYRN